MILDAFRLDDTAGKREAVMGLHEIFKSPAVPPAEIE